MAKKTVSVKGHKRSPNSPKPRKDPSSNKTGPKTVNVNKHSRTKPSS